jgi:hypothetical protein
MGVSDFGVRRRKLRIALISASRKGLQQRWDQWSGESWAAPGSSRWRTELEKSVRRDTATSWRSGGACSRRRHLPLFAPIYVPPE